MEYLRKRASESTNKTSTAGDAYSEFKVELIQFGLVYMYPGKPRADPIYVKFPTSASNIGSALSKHILDDKWSFRANSGEGSICGQIALCTSWGAICRKQGWPIPTVQDITRLIETDEYSDLACSPGIFHDDHQDEFWETENLSLAQLTMLTFTLAQKQNVTAQLAICMTEPSDPTVHSLQIYGPSKPCDFTVFIHHNGDSTGNGHWSGLGPKAFGPSVKTAVAPTTTQPSSPQLLSSNVVPSSSKQTTQPLNESRGRTTRGTGHAPGSVRFLDRFVARPPDTGLRDAQRKAKRSAENELADTRSERLRQEWVTCACDFQSHLNENMRNSTESQRDAARDGNYIQITSIEDRMRSLENSMGTRRGRACALAWLQVLGRGDWEFTRLLKNKELGYVLKKHAKNVTTTATNKQRIVYPDHEDFERSRASHKASIAITNVLKNPSSRKMMSRRQGVEQGSHSPAPEDSAQTPKSATRQTSRLPQSSSPLARTHDALKLVSALEAGHLHPRSPTLSGKRLTDVSQILGESHRIRKSSRRAANAFSRRVNAPPKAQSEPGNTDVGRYNDGTINNSNVASPSGARSTLDAVVDDSGFPSSRQSSVASLPHGGRDCRAYSTPPGDGPTAYQKSSQCGDANIDPTLDSVSHEQANHHVCLPLETLPATGNHGGNVASFLDQSQIDENRANSPIQQLSPNINAQPSHETRNLTIAETGTSAPNQFPVDYNPNAAYTQIFEESGNLTNMQCQVNADQLPATYGSEASVLQDFSHIFNTTSMQSQPYPTQYVSNDNPIDCDRVNRYYDAAVYELPAGASVIAQYNDTSPGTMAMNMLHTPTNTQEQDILPHLDGGHDDCGSFGNSQLQSYISQEGTQVDHSAYYEDSMQMDNEHATAYAHFWGNSGAQMGSECGNSLDEQDDFMTL